MDKKLEQLINNENTYFIHYASNGFYNGSSPAPKVSCIVLYFMGAEYFVLKAFGFRRDICTDQLMFIDKVVDYKHWFFGHYHFDRKINDKKTCLYHNSKINGTKMITIILV